MTRDDIFSIIGEVDDSLITRSEVTVKKTHRFMPYAGLLASAACLLFVFMIMKGNGVQENVSPVSTDPGIGTQDGGNGPDHPDNYIPGPVDGEESREEQAYGMATDLEWTDFNAGPIMPLTFAFANDKVVAKRELVYDFASVSQADKGYVPVQDNYVLYNTSETEQTVSVVYPYVSSGNDLIANMPEVFVNGEQKTTNIQNGAYMGINSEEMGYLFSSNVSTDEYSDMLREMTALEEDINWTLLNQKITVYEFSDFDAGSVPGEAVTYAATFDAERKEDVYFTNMMDVVNSDTGKVTLYFMFEQQKDSLIKPAIYFFGEVPAEYEEQGYVYPEFIEVNKSDEVTVRMSSRETTMAEILEEMVDAKLDELCAGDAAETAQLKELLYHRAAKMFGDMYLWDTDGQTTPEDDVFYAKSISDILYYVFEEESVYLLTDTVTIPAGGSTSVVFEYCKHGNHQTYEPREELRDNYGYDNMPNLGTNVVYEQITTEIKENGNIRIESQNYGFDLESGVKQVELELDAERYYMIVKILR